MESSKNIFQHKVFCLLIIILLIFSYRISGQNFVYHDSWGKAGFNIGNQGAGFVEVTYSVPVFSLDDVSLNGKAMKNIVLPGAFLFNDAGMPNLPGQGRYIAIPQGSVPKLTIISIRRDTIYNVEIQPAPVIPADTGNSPLKYQENSAVYHKNTFYPEEPVRVSGVRQIRSVDVILLGITPFQYNPVTKELVVMRDVKIRVSFSGGNGHFGVDSFRSHWFDPILKDAILNPGSLPVIDYSKRLLSILRKAAASNECEYIIIRPEDPEFQQWADSIANFRNQQGILTHVFSLTDVGGDTPTAIQNFLQNAYYNWTIKPVGVLLLGDYGNAQSYSIASPQLTMNDVTFVSDHVYADVNNDDMAELVIGRIVGNNEQQLGTICSKYLAYERTPPMDTGFYQHPVTTMGWQTDRWYQLCSEIIGGYFRSIGKHPVRVNAIYSGSVDTVWSSAPNTGQVVSYFGPAGLNYIPLQANQMPCCWYTGTPEQVNVAIEDGSFLVQHRDHGLPTGWGAPYYRNEHIDLLTNTGTRLPFVMSINCSTGKFNWTYESFAERFVRHTYNGYNSGCLGMVAPSELSFSFVNDVFTWGMYDNMWPDFMPGYGSTPYCRDICPAFAMVAGKYFLQQSNWPYDVEDKQVTYYLFHMFGDPFLRLFTEQPLTLTVEHNPVIIAGTTEFTVLTNDSAYIALTVNNQIIGTGWGNANNPTTITILPQTVGKQVRITVTKQNYLRYTDLVPVVADQLVVNFATMKDHLCVNSSTDFWDLTSGNPQSWLWSFEGGTPDISMLQNPAGIIYHIPGTFNVTLHVTKTGQTPQTLTKTGYIRIDHPAITDFSDSATCFGHPTQFTDKTTSQDAPVTRWEWDFGDPASGTDNNSALVNPVHLFTTPGTYFVHLTVTTSNDCISDTTEQVIITDIPGIPGTPSGNDQLCTGTTGNIFSTTGSIYADGYDWQIIPPEAGNFSSNILTGSLDLSPGFTGAAIINVRGSNECGKGGYSDDLPIVINSIPETASTPQGEDRVNTDTVASSVYTIPRIPGATGYSWFLDSDGITGAGAISGSDTVGIVLWTHSWVGTASITVSSSDSCGISAGSDPKTVNLFSSIAVSEIANSLIRVYPNPTGGKLNISFQQNIPSDVKIRIITPLGFTLFQSDFRRISGVSDQTIDLSGFSTGVYYLQIENDQGVLFRKSILVNK
ncbi:MAG: C25 family cysteine peptidase [Bacteroidetes bacterium]|nr:C25 family cysteine peptidase [Bacteroidota bacterium]